MQVTSSQFNEYANGAMRPLSWGANISWDKVFDDSLGFFTLNSSTLNGTDLLAPEESNILTEWDKYLYKNYEDRIMQMEWQREENVPYSTNLAFADIVLNNYDNFFTYGDPAKMETFYDSLRTDLDPSRWNKWGGSNVNVGGGYMSIYIDGTSMYRGVNVEYGYDLTGSYFSIQVVNPGDQTLTNFEAIPIELVNLYDRNDTLKISIENGTVYCFKKVNGSTTTLFSVAYNSAVHKFFKISESGGVTFWQYSTDGNTYLPLFSATNPIDVTHLEANIVAGKFSDGGAPTTAVYANVNTLSTGLPSTSLPVTSPIAQFALPRRPIRLLAGFGGENVPQFVGLTDKSPQVDSRSKTAKLHAEDFLSFLFNKPLDQTVMYQNYRTDQVLAALLQLFGLTPDQYSLDQGFNVIKFVYFEKGLKLGEAVNRLMEAELGSFYMDEVGVVVFRNRYRSTATPVYSFDRTNIIDMGVTDESTIINVVEIKANVREVQPTEAVFSTDTTVELANGASDVFFNFEDPVTTLDPITFYTANSAQDGSGSDVTSSVAVTATSLFASSVKVTFTNSSGAVAYITDLNIYGTPAKVVKELYLRVQDDASVEKFEERPILIENDFIQDTSGANSIALSLLNYYKNYANTVTIDVKGNPALQIGDNINVDQDTTSGVFNISKITSVLEAGKFRQTITARVHNIPSFFTLNVSTLNGSDVLGV